MPTGNTLRVVAIIIGTCAFIGMLFQEQLMVQIRSDDNKRITSVERYMMEEELIHERGGDAEGCKQSTDAAPQAATDTNIEITTDTATHLEISTDKPVFVLSLPNNGDYAIPRYFECGGYDKNTMARKFTGIIKTAKIGLELGECMKKNLQGDKPILEGCGTPKRVYTDAQWLAAPYLKKGKPKGQPHCFDPVLYPGSLEKLYEAYPHATIMNVVRDPLEWAKSLSRQLPPYWNEWCNFDHDDAFPSGAEVGTERSMAGFYLQYTHRIKDFIKEHPSWNYVEVDWDAEAEVTGHQLQSKLGIPSKCWVESTTGNTKLIFDPKVPKVLTDQKRPNHVAWPMLVTAMPKAGTTTMDGYFRCGVGPWTAVHQYAAKTVEPYNVVQIGRCMKENAENDVYPFLKDCGPSYVWSDTGVLGGRVCYYPQLHLNGLERFYKSYPYGTILNTVRGTESWVSSAFRWRELPNRWVKAGCEGFPNTTETTKEEWGLWYEQLQEHIRKFAREHPTLTYIEVPLGEHTGTMLNDIFRFPDRCWGHSNVNHKNMEKPANSTKTTRH